LDIWAQNGYRGIVNAVTGSGKTFLALSAIKKLETESIRKLRVKIVIPQTFLAAQWKGELKHHIGAKSAEVGIYSGKRREHNRKYMIYVINSARYNLARHILADINSGYSVLLIADECHHYGSTENSRIFDFYKVIDKSAPYYSLGLSATPEIVNFNTISIPLGREIYNYDLGKALRDRIISHFIVFNVMLNFTNKERVEYGQLSDSLSFYLASLKKKHPEIIGMPAGIFFTHLQRLAKHGGSVGTTAHTALSLMYKRRALSHMAAERIPCAISIINSLPKRSRVILFCERIHAAELLYRELSEQYPDQVGLYHSKMTEITRNDMLERYKHGTFRLLICCKALDEGLNIPSTDAGIIVSASMSARQRIQRLGRMLRHSKEIKRIYYLYMDESSEDNELVHGLNVLKNDVPLIDLVYNERTFLHTEYEKLRESVLHFVSSRRHNTDLLDALSQNIDKVLLRGDFLLPETVCRENLHISRSIEERNYWVSALYVILARHGKLW